MKAAKLPPVSEAAFQRQVIQLARLRGWRVAAFRPARTAKGWRTPCQGDAAGWPDLILARKGRLIAAELKSENGRTTPEQRNWLCVLGCAGAEIFIWRPSSWPEIERVLGAD